MKSRFLLGAIGAGLLLLGGLFLFLWLVFYTDFTIWGRRNIYNHLEVLATRARENPDDSEPIRELIAALKSGASHQRTSAAHFLGSLGPQAIPAIDDLTTAAGGSDGYVSAEAVRALGQIGPSAKTAVPTLLRLVKEQPQTSTGSSAVETLGRVADPDDGATISLLMDCEKSSDSSIRYTSNVALRTLEYRKANPTLHKIPPLSPSKEFHW